MKKETKRLIGFVRKNQKGFTLLEYAAGAAVLIGVVFGAMEAFGGGLSQFYTRLGDWATAQASNLPVDDGSGN